jgi:hypothetical protein
MITIEDMMDAYADCLRRKRGTVSAMEFRLNWMDEVVRLAASVNDRTYRPSTSICFVVTRPRLREVFAANFRDRIIHHDIALRLEPLFERVFSPRTFNCRKGKGQLYGVRRLEADLRECSCGYTRDCWVMKIDLKGFFMSIDKALLARMIDRFVCQCYQGPDLDDLRFLCRTVILHEPQLDCVRQSPPRLFDALPDHKTLFRNQPGRGLAIGNLFSQIFANFFLNGFDWFLHGITPWRGRYVDDVYLVHPSRLVLLSAVPQIRFVLAQLHLSLNERKFYFQHYSKGIKFTGAVVRVGRTYTSRRTVTAFVLSVRRLARACSIEDINHHVASVNSYLGLLRQHDNYAVRRKWLSTLPARLFQYIYIKGHYESVSIRKKYRL